MDYSWGLGVAVLAVAGCFSEPPSGSGGDPGTTSSGTTSSTGAEQSQTASTAEPVDDDGSEAGSTIGAPEPDVGVPEDLPTCGTSPIPTGVVPADVLIVVGEASVVTADDLVELHPGANVAILAPDEVVAVLQQSLLEACVGGCANCSPSPGQPLLIPYTPDQDGGAFGAFLAPGFECLFRPPLKNPVTSAPSAHLWLFTQDLSQVVPDEVVQRVGALGLRTHVACPSCDADDLDRTEKRSNLVRLIENTAGSLADSTESLAEQAAWISALRVSCEWLESDVPSVLVFDNQFSDTSEPFVAFDNAALGVGACEEMLEVEGVEEIVPLFTVTDNRVELCRAACFFAQLSDAADTDVYRCEL